jgi:DNA-binding NarL/FixJ family response regulator
MAGAPGAAGELNGDGKLSVLVVDDHAVVQWGFRLLLGRQPWMGDCAVASTPEEAVELAGQRKPDVALVDLFLGERSGAELCEPLREVSPKTRVLLISGAGWISPQAARAAGASGFISKDWSADEVANAVRMVGRGMTVFARQADGPATPLSEREREVLELIGAGATNREIAERLFLSPHTIKDHTTALYRKLGVRNRAEATRKAEQLGLTPRPSR